MYNSGHHIAGKGEDKEDKNDHILFREKAKATEAFWDDEFIYHLVSK